MKNTIVRRRAVTLRKKGLSFEVIAKKLAISKSTSHYWLKNIILNSEALARIRTSQKTGRIKGHQTKKAQALSIDKDILRLVKKNLGSIKISPALKKLLCAFLYWGKGEKSKNKLAFTNSDPKMVNLFLKLLREGFDIKEIKLSAFLHLHSYHNRQKQISFWSKVCGIPKSKIHVYNKTNFGKYKKNNYPGCISVRYHDFRLAKEINYLYKLFAEQFGGLV